MRPERPPPCRSVPGDGAVAPSGIPARPRASRRPARVPDPDPGNADTRGPDLRDPDLRDPDLLDPATFDALLRAAAGYPELRAAIARLGPISVAPPAHACVADHLFAEVINQQLSVRAAGAIRARIEAAAAAAGLRPRDLFAAGDAARLRACGLSAAKARALAAIVAAEAAGLLGPDLSARPRAERARILCGIRGVGPWTADMVGIFHVRDPDIWPAGDVAAAGCLRRLTGIDDTAAVAAGFAPHRSILARYLWRIRDAAPPGVSAGRAAGGDPA